MQLILQTANVTADAKNCSYPNKVTVTNASELQEAVKMDHVCAKYKNNYRSIDNFLKSNVVVMDLDNDHTDDPDEWITAEKLEELLPDISYAVAPSRNHMVAKNGKAARPKYHEEALIIAYGEGRNGKSTFWNTVSKVLGTYAGTISADTMTANCRRNVKPEIAELKGKRLAIAAELEEGMLLSTSVLKQVCSTDVVRGEKKFKDPFDYTPTHTVVLYTNHLPKVRATDEGTWRRLIVIPFHAKIEGKSDIKNYSDYLFENAGSYVLAWIIEGARKAIEADFHLERPKVVADAIAEYRGMNDWLEHFLEECCVRGDGLEEKSGELYQEYRSYCLRTGEISRNNADFTAVLEKAGYTRKKKKTGMWVQGLQLKDTDFAE